MCHANSHFIPRWGSFTLFFSSSFHLLFSFLFLLVHYKFLEPFQSLSTLCNMAVRKSPSVAHVMTYIPLPVAHMRRPHSIPTHASQSHSQLLMWVYPHSQFLMWVLYRFHSQLLKWVDPTPSCSHSWADPTPNCSHEQIPLPIAHMSRSNSWADPTPSYSHQ